MIVSVIIPTYLPSKYLYNAFNSVRNQDFPTTMYEILLIDNASQPRQELKALCDSSSELSIQYIHEPTTGLHNARHAGARFARGEILAYIDDDVIAHDCWLKTMVEPYSDPDVACVGGKTVPKWEAPPPDWITQFAKSGGSYLSILDLGNELLKLHWPQTLYGCNMSIRRKVLFEVGGFNPDAIGDRRLIWLRGDGETGIHKKVYEAGYKVIYEPKAWVFHQIPKDRLRPSSFYWRAFIQGISDSFSFIRESKPSKVYLMRNIAIEFLWAWLNLFRSLYHPDRRIFLRSQSAYWYGKAQHQLRVLLNPDLRAHVLKKTYL